MEQTLGRMQITNAETNNSEAEGAPPGSQLAQSPPRDPSLEIQGVPQGWMDPTSLPNPMPTSLSTILPTPPPSGGSSPITDGVQTEQNFCSGQETGIWTWLCYLECGHYHVIFILLILGRLVETWRQDWLNTNGLPRMVISGTHFWTPLTN